MEHPLVSVVIPFYSNKGWLVEAINSVLNQTYPNLEILVINDGSPENIDELNIKFQSQIKIINKKNGGPASARNTGIEKANGKYIAFLDSDDIWMPEKLSNQIPYMESNNIVWSQHSYEMFWDGKLKSKVIDTSMYNGEVYTDCFISFKIQTSCVVVLRTILIENNIKFPLNKRYGQDTSFFREIAKLYPIGYINGVQSKFRIRGSNAGFRAKVQLNDKAALWDEIKNDKDLIRILPYPIIMAYKISNVFNRIINQLDTKNIRENVIENFSKFLYIFPYSIFKIYSRKSA